MAILAQIAMPTNSVIGAARHVKTTQFLRFAKGKLCLTQIARIPFVVQTLKQSMANSGALTV